MDTFTPQDFFREVLEFRKLMGDVRFWAKSSTERNVAIKALGVVYLNTSPASDQVASIFEGTIQEYGKRELLLLKAGKTTVEY
jgi:hypothetical protein